MDRSARFWDKFAERYAKQPIADAAAYQKKLQVTREYFQSDMEETMATGRGNRAGQFQRLAFLRDAQHAIIDS